MKKRVLALALCLSMLPLGSVHAAGSAEDPLISESYINGTFIPAVESVVKVMLEDAKDSHSEPISPSTGMVTKELSAGKNIKLGTGQVIILLSGSAEIVKDRGAIVNATMGLEAGSGILYKNHRYIVCEDSAATVKILKSSTVYMSESAEIEDGKIEDSETDGGTQSGNEKPETEPPAVSPAEPSAKPETSPSPTPSESPTPSSPRLPFVDVDPEDWYYDELLFCYENGLIDGMTPTIFGGGNRLTVAESYKLSACLHQLYHATSLFPGNGKPWYKGYVDYCTGFDISCGEFSSYNSAITRRQFAEMLYSALPASELTPINDIPEGSISDISETGEWVDRVYDLYRAGIFTGYTADSLHNEHDFAPDNYISRAEMVSVICRILDDSQRIHFIIE